VRVVAGSARGRRLEAPSGQLTRPTTDRVREATFNALWSRGLVDGATVLDLFAGSGALGIEALSRGAAHATFVDDDPAARRAVARNLATCGFADRADIVAGTAERHLDRMAAAGATADLAFCDPPYAFAGWGPLLARLPADVVVIEAGEPVDLPAGWELVRGARYGGTWVGIVERVPAPNDHDAGAD
jgi:16S rRNA (guanine966-N2)-methyltransferase